MTEPMKKQEVSIAGEKVEVITREEAERVICGADPKKIVAYAFEAAVCPDGGAAMIDLQNGNIASHSFNGGEPPDEAAYGLLRTEENSVYESVLDDAYRGADGLTGSLLDRREIDGVLGRVRARMRAEGRDGREIDGVDAESLHQEDIDDYLMETANESYRDRLGQAYAHELSAAHELPKPRHFLAFARPHLDRVYGAKGKTTERTQG